MAPVLRHFHPSHGPSGHHHGHEHGHAHGAHDIARDSRALVIAMVTTSLIFLVQLVGGIVSNSLALLSDSGHMFVDMASIMISYLGLRLAAKRTQSHRFNYGWRRVEILAALLNGTILFIMCAIIFSEAIQRFAHPEEVHAHEMLVVAIVGMIANAVALYNLHGSEHLTTRSAYLHVLTDLLSSVGVIVGAVVIEWTSWTLVDPVISVLITVFIARGAYALVKKAVVILMESTPEHLDLDVIRSSMCDHPGIAGIHDVHVWHIGAHSHALSAHAVVEAGHDNDAVLKDLRDMLSERFGLTHTTLQLETMGFHATNHCASCDDAGAHAEARPHRDSQVHDGA